MFNPCGITTAALLLLGSGAPGPVESAPVAADAMIMRVEAEVAGDCAYASGAVAADYGGAEYAIWDEPIPRRLCDGDQLLPGPIAIETVWTGHPDADAPIRVRVDLDVVAAKSARAQTQVFWFYPYGPDGDCVNKVKQSSVTAEVVVDTEIRFCS